MDMINAITENDDQINGLTVPCECSVCGQLFHVTYHVDGTYEYGEDVCDCDGDYHPVEGYPSISEWLAYRKKAFHIT